MRRGRSALRAKAAWLGALGGLALGASPLGAQPAPTPPPEGVQQGQGAAFPKGNYAALNQLPDWGGIWILNRGAPGSAPPAAVPKLKGEYKTRYEDWRREVLANDGVEKRTRSNCSPPGMPRIMQLAQYPYEFIFSPGRVTIVQEAWMQIRTVWTDGRLHSEDADPSYMGDAVGRWEGDTLVIETKGILEDLVFATGAPHSANFKVTERIRLDPANPDILTNTLTMEDPDALEEPYTATVSYRRDRYGVLFEFQCSENDRNPVNEHGETQFD